MLDYHKVTYVNHIEHCDVWQRHGGIQRVLQSRASLERALLPEPDGGMFHQKFVILSESSERVGRLHTSSTPAWTDGEDSPIVVQNLAALGEPVDRAFDFLYLGGSWIVKGFAALTTTDMRRVWGRIDA